ncbi:MAG: ABC-F family ATP-binding cassette domain-containing protein [bacterium]|nr:ABC-F family ATP-binding cassette domain-containing protein [bacterium]
MIKVENLSYSFPEKDLYTDISFTLEPGDHCAFIGTSGTGKSTLVDILMNPDRYMYDGKLTIEENCRIGFVSQFSQLDDKKEITVFEYLAEDFLKMQDEITAICEEMGTTSDFDAVMERYQDALDAFSAIDGDNYESNITKNLNLANLGQHKDLLVSKLSGGEFKLIQVIREMLHAPEVMIMDEPDVFLDFEHVNSLKALINSHKGILLIITHNRYLLNNCFNKIIHLENKELQEFNGRYIDYNFALLQGKIELQEIVAEEEEEIERQKKIIDKYRTDATFFTCASRGRALHARVSLLERLEARRLKAPFVEIKQPKINLATSNEIEETTALKVTDYSVGFDHPLLENVSFEIKSNEKVAIIGPNGTGKTTLLREIYRNDNPAIEVNEDIKMALLSQLQSDMLNEANTVQDEFFDAGFNTYDEIKAHIADYGFSDEVMTQKISDLSGGEKNILQLAKVSASGANMLLLDEPTSHLDTYSQLALEEAIANYNGAVIMISHDFYSIVNCADYVLIIEDKNIRKMSMRKFRQMIYAKHFDKDYLEIEKKKKEVETKIARALQDKNFELARQLSEKLEEFNKLL